MKKNKLTEKEIMMREIARALKSPDNFDDIMIQFIKNDKARRKR